MSPTPDLETQVRRFAATVTQTIQAVLGRKDVMLHADLLHSSKFTVRTTERIVLAADGVDLLTLHAEFYCGWDDRNTWARVDESKFVVSAVGVKEPLFRYEFLRDTGGGLPSAHLHAHAHRDAVTFAMCRTGSRTRRARTSGETDTPRSMSELHFPLGGDRFRPSLEDVLQMLVEEFGVEAEDGWQEKLADSREQWRRIQVKASVRDAPADAAEQLRSLGYEITPPTGGDPAGSQSILRKP